MSTRKGGVSLGPYASLNLRPVGLDAAPTKAPKARHSAQDPGELGAAGPDDAEAVAENIRRFESAIGVRPVFLRQVHGTGVVNLDGMDGGRDGGSDGLPTADAAVTTRCDVACTVLVADCLPVLFADRQGRAVGAAHAGWRGLAAGVLEATLQSLCQAASCEPPEVLAWLGPCIGPDAFEVGEDVLQAFGAAAPTPQAVAHPRAAFTYSPRPDGTPRWRADLAGLAQDRLRSAGVRQISGSGLCTVRDPSRFFSFRRDGLTGRMAASVWRRS